MIRESRTKGVGYVSSYKGKQIESESCPKDVTCKCPMKCYSKVDNEAVKDTWDYFYNLENKNSQDVYWQALIVAKTVGRHSKSNKNIQVTLENELEQENEESETVYKRNLTYVCHINI